MADLDATAIADFRSRWAFTAKNRRLLSSSDERILIDAELLKGNPLTYAALILFGTQRALGVHLPQAEIIFEYRSTEAPGPAQDRHEFREGFLLFHDAIWDRLNLRNGDYDSNKSKVLQHLRGRGSGGSRLAEIRQIVPDLSESAVQRLLDELRLKGQITVTGQRRWARWRASDKARQGSKSGP